MSAETDAAFVPPYISFAQLLNVLDRMAAEGVPGRIDRSYLATWSGSAQAQFLKAAQSLGLRDEHQRPTELLKRLVAEPDARPEIIGQMVREHYADAVALGESATSAQLEEVFREYPGISGSTTRKAITFYLHAAKFAGIPTSPFFSSGRASGGSGSRPRSRPARKVPPTPTPPAPAADPLAGLHPAVVTLVKSLPPATLGEKVDFPAADRKAWFAYAEATFNLIYDDPEGVGS